MASVLLISDITVGVCMSLGWERGLSGWVGKVIGWEWGRWDGGLSYYVFSAWGAGGVGQGLGIYGWGG